MFRKKIFFVISIMILVLLVAGCNSAEFKRQAIRQSSIEEAKEMSETFIKGFVEPGADSRDRWGLTEMRVFGLYRYPKGVYLLDILPQALNLLTTGNTKETAGEDPLTVVKVTYPFWVRGLDDSGDFRKFARKLEVTVTREDEASDWVIQNYEFIEEKPLSFLKQAFAWVASIFFAPIVIFFILMLFLGFAQSINGITTRYALLISGILSIPVVGYASYVCFGSWLSVFVGMAICLLAPFLLLRSIAT